MGIGAPAFILGLIAAGDVGGITVYTDRHMRKIAYPQSPPKTDPSPMQIKQRNRFVAAVANWKLLPQSEKIDWEQISLKASLQMTGHNLFVHVSLKNDLGILATLQRQTGISVSNPEFVEWPTE